MRLTILLLFLSSFCYAQTQIGTNQIKDAAVTQAKLGAASVSNAKIATGAVTETKIADDAVTQAKLADDALRPANGGALTDPDLIFGPEYRRKYTLPVTSDIALTLSSSTQTADSYIFISTIPDGSHVVSFPNDWVIKNNGAFDPTQTQRIELYYDGNKVYVDIFNADPIVLSSLVTGVVVGGTDDITLAFSNPVTITTAGWTFSASGGAVTVSSVVSGSGTATVVFDLSRNITAGEDMTVSYDPATGNTLSLTGNEISIVSNLIVDTGDGSIPPNSIVVDDDAVDDTAAGTVADPFKTIQAASNVATAGQTVLVRAGTYRETVVAKAGVIYQNYPGEVATISGLTAISNGAWTVHAGNIYKCTVTLNGGNNYIDNNNTNTTLHANQIFKDGVMMIEARWPNSTGVEALFNRVTALRQRNMVTSAGGQWGSPSGTINDPGIPNTNAVTGAFSWAGGKHWMTGWYIAKTGNITSHSGNTITFTNAIPDDPNYKRFEQYYYLTGKLGGLDIANEWHYDSPATSDDGTNSNTLYFWQIGNGSPTGVEYKTRNWGFDTRGKANVTIKGLHFIGCDPIQSDVNAPNLMVDGIRALYTNHTFLLTGGSDLYTNARRTGSQIIGGGSTLKNSEFKYCASQMVWAGQACRIENNLFEWGNYEGNYGSFVNFWNPGNTANQVITRNTMTNNGRSAIDFSEWEGKYPGNEAHLNMDISYNDISGSLMLSSDGGQTYGSVYTDLTGLRMHHNWIHDSKAAVTPTAAHVVGVAAGIYYDQASGPSLTDHNVLWNNYMIDFHAQQNGLPGRNAGKNWLINNTFATGPYSIWYSGQVAYLTITTTSWDYMRNNIFIDGVYINGLTIPNNGTAPGNLANSIRYTTDWGGTGTDPLLEGLAGTSLWPIGGSTWPASTLVANPEAYFQLKSGSPGVNTGTVIPAGEIIPNIPDNSIFTADAVGLPDIGAYERTVTAWVPGYNSVAADEDVYIEDNNLTFTSYSTTPTTFSNSAFHGGTATYFGTASGTVTITFTGTAFEWYAEKSSNQGIIEVQVDNVRQDCDTGTGGTQDCDNYAATSTNNSTLIFSKTGMSAGQHTIELITTGTKNASSTDFHVVHDTIKDTTP